MKMSIQTKLLMLCILLILLTTIGISGTYYILTKQDKQRESRQRIQVAFEIIGDDMLGRIQDYSGKIEEFLQQASILEWGLSLYQKAETPQSFFSSTMNASHLTRMGGELQRFSRLIKANQLLLYGADGRLLVAYHNEQGQEFVGAYVMTATGPTYLPTEQYNLLLMNQKPLPDAALPDGLAAEFRGAWPDTIVTEQVRVDGQLGLRVTAPISDEADKIGLLVGDVYFSQDLVDRYASLSHTEVNLFAENRWSIGTLPAQGELDIEAFEQLVPCEVLLAQKSVIKTVSLMFDSQDYYQGQCALQDAQGEAVGAITVSLSQEIEQQEIRKILTTVLMVSVIATILAFGLTVAASRKPVRFIQQLIRYIDRISKGDIPDKITVEYTGEFHDIKQNLNLLIEASHETTRIAEEVANGNLGVEVKERSDNDRLMRALNRMIRRLNEVMELAERIADGDLNVTVTERSDEDRLMTALKRMTQRLNAMMEEVATLILAVQEGTLSARGNVEGFTGGWAELVQGINTVIDAFVTPINVTAEYIEHLSKSEIPDEITEEYKGDFNKIKDNLNLLGRDIRNVLHETTELSQAIQDGNLDTRGNTEAFGGGWRDLVVGMNTVIEAFVKPITMAATHIDRIAKGDIPDTITDEYNGDFNQIKENVNLLIEASHEMTRLAEEMAEGNLTVEVKERSAQDTLMHALNAMITKLNEVVVQVKSAADNVATGSRQMRTSSEEMSQGAAVQAASAEEVSSSMEQMTANIRQNAENARQTEQIALQSAEYAEQSGRVVADTVQAMQQIAKKIAIIQEIADQTRMLSLNATIEAGRAQEHGKAFSVVAAEVRKLSDMTKRAAEEISTLATSSLDVSERAGEMLTTLLPSIRKTSDLVQEITAASGEQSSGAEQVNTAIQQLDQITQQNSITAEEMASTSEELAVQAEQLRDTMCFFRIVEARYEPDDRHTQPRDGVSRQHTIVSPDSGSRGERPRAHTQKERPDAPRENPSDGSLIEIHEVEEGSDERDEEFERY